MPSKHPWSAIPATRSSAPVLKIKLYAVLGGVVLAALAGPLSLFLAASQKEAVATEPEVDYSTTGFAQMVAEDFLSARTTTLPVAEGLSPNFGQTPGPDGVVPTALPYSSLTLYGTEGPKVDSEQTYDITSFLFRLGGEPMRVEVTTLRTDDGPVVGAMPALLPVDTTTADKILPMDYKENPALVEYSSEALQGAVQEWAAAYAADDQDGLYAITGERRAGQTYKGLGGFTVVDDVSIISAVQESAANVPVVADTTVVNPLYLRVKVLLQADGADRYSASTEFDLLVNDSESGSPRVLAWGSPGSAPLKPFSNSNRH